MKPYAFLLGAGLWGASCWYAFVLGQDVETATQVREERAAQVSREAALQVTAEAISRIKVEHRTIQNEVQREILEKPVYRDCRHDADSLRRINSAIIGGSSEPAGSGGLPGTDAVERPVIWRDDP
ncbi:MAG: hypothetical protein ACOVN4_04340 [Bosea sp. (in: a-proteobacteria)]|jgi:hypothetical protein